MKFSPVDVLRQFLFVRETQGPNRGVWVNLFLQYTDTPSGSSWCAAFLCFCLSICYQGLSPLSKSASTDVLLAQCRTKGWIVTVPQAGDLYFFVNTPTDAHHCGVVCNTAPLTGIAGNTSVDGHSSNGDRVAEHVIGVRPEGVVFARLPH